MDSYGLSALQLCVRRQFVARERAHDARRRAVAERARRKTLQHDGTSADDAPSADADERGDLGADAEKHALFDHGAAAEVHAGGDLGVVLHDAVVTDGRKRVEDDAAADPRAGVDDAPRHGDGPLADESLRGKRGVGVKHRDESPSILGQPLGHAATRLVLANGDEHVAPLSCLVQSGDRTQHADAVHVLDLFPPVVEQDKSDVVSIAHTKAVHGNATVPAGSHNRHPHVRSPLRGPPPARLALSSPAYALDPLRAMDAAARLGVRRHSDYAQRSKIMAKPTLVRLWNTAHVGLRGRFERRLPFLPWSWLERLQRHRVRAAVAHAYRKVPFYRDAMDRAHLRPEDFRTAADLAWLPLVDGPLVLRDLDRFLATDIASRTIYRLFSTGTSRTGQKRILWDEAALLRQVSHGERDRVVLYRLVGRSTGLRRLSLFPPESSTAEVTRFHHDSLFVPQSFAQTQSLSSHASYEEIAARVNDLRPDVVFSYGSVAEGFFRHVAAHGIELRPPRVWVYGGDTLSDEGRALIEGRFHCLVYSTYQAVEIGRLGFQCEERRGFHINADYCPVRVVDAEGREVSPGETGEIVVSNLENRAMVLLNYKIGDRGALSASPCPCGRSLPLLARLEGRASAVLHLPDGREILDHVVTHAYKDALEDALGFQVVELCPGNFLWRVVPAPGIDTEALKRRILDAARSVLGDECTLELEFVDRLERGRLGKLDRVIRRPIQDD